MSAITLKVASYWRYQAPCFGPGAALEPAIGAMADGIAEQAAQALALAGPEWQPTDFVICSTIVSAMITNVAGERAQLFRSHLQQRLPVRTPYVVNAYECASWGYVLRHCACLPGTRRVLLAIADLDVHQFAHWTEAELWRNLWGHTGFGVSVLCLELGEEARESLLLSAGGGNPMMEFAKQVKAAIARHPQAALCQPFFPLKTQEMFAKLVGSANPQPELHAAWGHCFGSDPWIALIERRRAAGADAQPASALLASLAFNGYSAVARVDLAPQLRIDLQDRPALLATPLPVARERDAVPA